MLHWPLNGEQVETNPGRFIECLDVLKKRQTETSDNYGTPWFQVQEKLIRDKWSKHLVIQYLLFKGFKLALGHLVTDGSR